MYQENHAKSEEELQRTEVEIREAEASLVHVQERLEQLDEEKQALEELKKVEREKKGIEAVMLEAELKEGKVKLKRGETALSEVESGENKKKLAEVVKTSSANIEQRRSLEAKVVACELELANQLQVTKKDSRKGPWVHNVGKEELSVQTSISDIISVLRITHQFASIQYSFDSVIKEDERIIVDQ